MISFAKKILTTGRTTTTQPIGSDARVRKYSLTSAHEQPAPVSGTSFTLNPEHLFSSAHPFGWGGGTNGGYGAPRAGGFTTNDTTVMLQGASNLDTLGESNLIEDSNQHPSREESPLEGNGSGTSCSNESLTHAITTRRLSNSGSPCSLPREDVYDSHRTEGQQSSDEKVSESQAQSETSQFSSLYSFTDDVLSSATTISDVPANSTLSLNVPEASTRFLRARRKQRPRELKPRRKTLDVFNFGSGESSDKMSWSQSKSSTPSPTNLELDLRPKRSKSGSSTQRYSMGESMDGSDVVTSLEDEVLGLPVSFRSSPWPVIYSSSDDLISDVSRGVGRRGTGASADGVSRASGLRRGSLYASAICVSEMKRCQVIADLDLLEEDTEFEPCAVPFENTVVLWPAAVDKPSCFESSRFSRSWITSLEATGFVGSECLLMAPVTLSQGLQEHTQLLLLFPSHLLFAEQKSHSLLKLDQKVAIGDIWLSTQKEDVAEVLEMDSALDGSRSFVLGWPTATNTVVTFCTSEEKVIWVARIEKLIEVEAGKDKDPDRQLSIKVVYKERGHTKSRELSVSKSEKSSQLLQRCLLDFHLEAISSKDFQLFVRWGKEQPLQPLLGHESPFLFETWFQALSSRKDSSHGYCFVLRERKRTKLGARDTVSRRRTTKVPLRTLFRRSRTAKSGPSLFGSNLSEICVNDAIPGRIQTLFRYLYEHGPATDGVFRKQGGHKEVSDFKQHVDSADDINFDDVSVHVVAAVVKEWLRRLPDCLLSSDFYLQWIEVSKISNVDLLHEELRRLSSTLPTCHLLVLSHLMCVLHRIQLHSKQNRMTPFNLAVCIAPNILRPPPTASIDLQLTSVAIANMVVGRMIDAIEPVLGSDCVDLYRDIADPRVIQEFDVDGSYEQNLSLEHSLAPNSTAQSMESLDSLHDNTAVAESRQVLESMSPDSGLAASNPQLYEEDPLTSTTHFLKRASQGHEKSEPCDVAESPTAFDSDTGSLSSQASEPASGSTVPVRMRGAINDRDHLRRLRSSKMEEFARSFDDQFSLSDDRSDSVVVATEDLRSDEEKSEEEKHETGTPYDEKVAVSYLTEHGEGDKIHKEENQNSETTLSEDQKNMVAFDMKNDTAKVSLNNPLESQSQPALIEIVTSKIVSTRGEYIPQTVCGLQESPMSVSAVKNCIEKMEGRCPKNISPRNQTPLTSLVNQDASVISDIPTAVEMTACKPQEVLPAASRKVARSGSARRGPIDLVRATPENRERQEEVSSNLSQKDRSKQTDSEDMSGEIIVSKANHPLESGRVGDHNVSSESLTVSRQTDLTVSGEASWHVEQPQSFVRVCAAPRGNITEDRKPQSRPSGLPETCFAPISHSGLADPRVGTLDICSAEKTIASRTKDHRRDDGSRDGAGPSDRLGDIRWRDQPRASNLKVQLRECRLKDLPRDDRHLQLQSTDRRPKDRPRDNQLKDQPRDDRLKDQPRDSQLKDQPRDNRLKDQPRDSQLKDQPRDRRPKVQSRNIDNNWRLERVVNRVPVHDSESMDRGTSARVITSAYVRHITSEGCRVTMGTPTGLLPRYLPQNGGPPRSREPVRRADRFGARRSVTVIQLNDEDSVIVQKNVKMT